MRTLFVALATALALLASGCTGNCRRLSEKLCECANNTPERQICISEVATNEKQTAITAEDEVRCGELLAAGQCDCHNLETAEGKRACGLAY